MKRIAFIATAAREGGAWRIVTEFAKRMREEEGVEALFITTQPLPVEGVRNAVVGAMSRWRRAWFESFGIRGLLRSGGWEPEVVISLNNLPVLGAWGISQYVYFHQALPFYQDPKWSWEPRERELFLYQRFYGLLAWLAIRMTGSRVIVQTQTMVDKVRDAWGLEAASWFPDFSPGMPEAPPEGDPEEVRLFYPAADQPYKNHQVLAEALEVIRVRHPEVYRALRIMFTVGEAHRRPPFLDPNLHFVGTCSHAEVDAYYRCSVGLLFPSLVETVGLPLVEASALGMPILCADLPYAREILEAYEGATFVPARDPEGWADAIIDLFNVIRMRGRFLRHDQFTPPLRKANLGDLRSER